MTPREYADFRINYILADVLPPGTKLSAVRLTDLRTKLREQMRPDYESMHRLATENESLKREVRSLSFRVEDN